MLKKRLIGYYYKLRWLYYKIQGKNIVHFLHIGKTGGTAIKETLEPYLKTRKYVVKLHEHGYTLKRVPQGEKAFFVLRNPLDRFVSGFYSRQRKGQPRRFYEWEKGEAKAFKRFNTPNELAKALSSEDVDLRENAKKAMRSIIHVRNSYFDWLIDEKYFQTRLTDVVFVGFQESLDDGFEQLKKTLGLPEDLYLPKDGKKAHRSPSNLDKRLEEVAVQNLKEWYARDIQIYEWCKAHFAK